MWSRDFIWLTIIITTLLVLNYSCSASRDKTIRPEPGQVDSLIVDVVKAPPLKKNPYECIRVHKIKNRLSENRTVCLPNQIKPN
jgi:hypothetical protein